jgi:Putative transposase of IS4/5 family (DUF4096)
MTVDEPNIVRGSYTLPPKEKEKLDDLVKKIYGVSPRINKSEIIRIGINEVGKKDNFEIIQTLNNLGRFSVGKPRKTVQEVSVSELTVSDEQWGKVSKIFLKNSTLNIEGRPQINNRQVINGILYIFRYKKQRRNIPSEYGSFATCRRRLTEWENNSWKEICSLLIDNSNNLDEKHELEGVLLRTLLIDTKDRSK